MLATLIYKKKLHCIFLCVNLICIFLWIFCIGLHPDETSCCNGLYWVSESHCGRSQGSKGHCCSWRTHVEGKKFNSCFISLKPVKILRFLLLLLLIFYIFVLSFLSTYGILKFCLKKFRKMFDPHLYVDKLNFVNYHTALKKCMLFWINCSMLINN